MKPMMTILISGAYGLPVASFKLGIQASPFESETLPNQITGFKPSAWLSLKLVRMTSNDFKRTRIFSFATNAKVDTHTELSSLLSETFLMNESFDYKEELSPSEAQGVRTLTVIDDAPFSLVSEQDLPSFDQLQSLDHMA